MIQLHYKTFVHATTQRQLDIVLEHVGAYWTSGIHGGTDVATIGGVVPVTSGMDEFRRIFTEFREANKNKEKRKNG